MEHRNRLVEPPEAVGIGDELVGQVAEVLLVDAVVRVQVRHDHLRGIEAQARQLPVQPPAAVRHRARLADDDARLERIEDVEEVPEPRPEDLAQLGDVLATLDVRLAGDDRDHPPVARVVGVGERLDRLVELLVRLRVGRDEGDVPELARIRQRVSLAAISRARLRRSSTSRRSSRRPPRAASLLPAASSSAIRTLDPLDQVRQLVEAAPADRASEKARWRQSIATTRRIRRNEIATLTDRMIARYIQ